MSKRNVATNHSEPRDDAPLSEIAGVLDSPSRRFLRRFLQHRLAVLGLIALILLIGIAIAAPLLAPFDPLETGLAMRRSAPSSLHLLGVDSVGRDLMSRLIFGARASLIVGFGAVGVQVLVGTVVGATAGYAGGITDSVLMRIADVILSFPSFVVVVAAVSVIGPGLANVVWVVGILGWPSVARLVRAQALALREYPFVEAAHAQGASHWRIVFRHILPNTLPTVVIAATFGMARAILLEAALSYLGMGVQPPMPSWGNLLAEAQSLTVLESMPWMWLPPGICIMILALAINFVGDGLRDALDPQTVIRTND